MTLSPFLIALASLATLIGLIWLVLPLLVPRLPPCRCIHCGQEFSIEQNPFHEDQCNGDAA